ncbi:hypothetical protein F4803DRAFT_540811 [Xylaria telfairii]|nr:hypothetical protein F4803DRAFT_540811 [Xylaria telfairii]
MRNMNIIEVDGDVIPLSPLDNVRTHCYTNYLLPIALEPKCEIREVYSILQGSLSMTVAEMPIYGGKVCYRPQGRPAWKRGQLEVRTPNTDWLVDPYPLALQDFSDRFDFQDMKATGFPEEDLDRMLLLPEAFELDIYEGLDVAVAQANIVRNGCILGIGIWNSVSDVYGAFNMISLWASNAKKLQTNATLRRSVQIPPSVIEKNNDRDVLTKIWRDEGGENIKEMSSASAEDQRLWRYLGLHHPSATAEMPPLGANAPEPAAIQRRMRTCMFYVSEKSFCQLGQDNAPTHLATESAPITTNDILNALIWRCIMKSRFPGDNSGQKDMASNYQIALDGRTQFSQKLESSYLGNVGFFGASTLPLSTVTGPSTTLTSLAVALRKSLDSYTVTDMCRSFGIAHDITDYSTLLYTLADSGGATINVSTTLQAPIVSLDFGPTFGLGGAGNIECIRMLKHKSDQTLRRVLVMPMIKDGGSEIIVTLSEDEMDRLLADKEWAKYVGQYPKKKET